MAWNNHPLRRSTRHSGGDFNLYGLDPEGRKAHLAKHMYGPWQPPTIAQTRFSGKSQAPPRYGPPSSEQRAWLPRVFIQCDPPLYYGRPSPPYLPSPLELDLIAFDQLVARPRRHLDAPDQAATQPLALITQGGECPTLSTGCYSHIIRQCGLCPLFTRQVLVGPHTCFTSRPLLLGQILNILRACIFSFGVRVDDWGTVCTGMGALGS